MKRWGLSLLFLLLSGAASNMAAQTTRYTITSSSVVNGNHLTNCPSQIASVNGQATNPRDGGICFLATSSGGDPINPSGTTCAGPNSSSGQCFSAYLFDNAYGGNYYTDGCVYDTTTNACESLPFPVTTYCAPATPPGTGCGVGSTYKLTFDYWFPQQQEPNPLSGDANAWIGSITIKLKTNNFYQVCVRFHGCQYVANNVITGGTGRVEPQ